MATTRATTSATAPTMAAMASWAAETYGDHAAARFKADGEWRTTSYADMGAIVREIGLGLMDIGVESGDRVCLLGNTRPEWTYVDLAASSTGAIVVPIYPTNSPEECEWVAGNAGARVIVCEDGAQVAKIEEVRGRLPELETVITIDVGDGASTTVLDDLRERGRKGDPAALEQRTAAVEPGDPFTFVYTSGTTGPPKGCVLSHGNWRAVCDMIKELAVVEPGDLVYLYLPLCHVFARLVQLVAYDLGGTIAYFGGDTRQIVPELSDVKPTYFPSVPRIFEKIYSLSTAGLEQASAEKRERFQETVKVGVKVRDMQQRGEPVPEKLRQAFDKADEKIFQKVRAAFGGNVREASTGAAPIAPDILEFFYASGVPVLEGYGMTETTGVATASTVEEHKFGTVGRALPGVQVKIADDGEVLLKGANIFQGYYKNEEATRESLVDGWLRTGDLGRIDDEGYVQITGRKKDIIITAGGKNLTPANLENDLKGSRWVSQAVMYGDRRPFPVALITLDAEEMVQFAKENGLPGDMPSLAKDPEVRALIQTDLDRANAKYAQVEQIKKFAILDHDLSQESGELTPTLKVKRNVVNEKYADIFEGLYSK
jgi:long-chain acyl-CoA synthetase